VDAVAAFSLRQTPAERQEEEEALEWEYLLAAEWTQVALRPPRRLEAVGAEGQLEGPHVFERLQPL